MSKSSIITRLRELGLPTHRPPTHPGEILDEEYRKPLGLTQQAFADAIGVNRVNLAQIIGGKRPVTLPIAMRLARALGTSPDLWLNLQRAVEYYDFLHSKDADAIVPIRRFARAKKTPPSKLRVDRVAKERARKKHLVEA